MDVEVDDPFWTVRTPKLTLRFTVGEGEEPATLEDGDVLIITPDGERWCANILTMGKIQEAMDRQRGTGESLDGAYFWVQGLVIVREPGVESMVRAVEGLLDAYGDLNGILPRLGPADEEDDDL
jgi:hypothetical protein